MSTTQEAPLAPPSPPDRPGKFRSLMAYIFLPHAKPGEIVIISHSNLFYWWPVWLTGFILATMTYFDGSQMAVVPAGTRVHEAKQSVDVPGDDGKSSGERAERHVLVLPEGKTPVQRTKADGEKENLQPRVLMSPSKNYGIIFMIVLLVVIFITNVPLRGLMSVLVIVVLVMLAVIFAQAGIWERILNRANLLAIHINLGGYLFLSVVLFVLWVINFWFFDRQFYMIFTPGQVRVHLEIGAGETAYDTTGMVFQKQRSDLFRHWILGFGSGDLIVRPAGGVQHIDLPNVLGVGRRVRQIERKLAEKQVVAAPGQA